MELLVDLVETQLQQGVHDTLLGDDVVGGGRDGRIGVAQALCVQRSECGVSRGVRQ
jgi:hypothetical protein